MHLLSKKRYILLMLLPTLILYIGYVIVPIGVSFYYSLTTFTGIGAAEFVGWRNFGALAQDPLFWDSLKNTLIVLVVSLVVLVPCALGVGLLFQAKMRGSSVLRAFVFSPSVIAPILVGLIWVFVLDPQIGFINSALRALGIRGALPLWIGGTVLTPYSVGIVYMWQTIGFIATIFLAGLRTIPSDVYEASAIDGATSTQQLFRITIPLLAETFNIVVVLVVTGVFKIFELVYQLTNGGPNHLSDVLVTYMYSTTFASGEYGYGMAIAVAAFVLTTAISLIFLLAFNCRRTV